MNADHKLRNCFRASVLALGSILFSMQSSAAHAVAVTAEGQFDWSSFTVTALPFGGSATAPVVSFSPSRTYSGSNYGIPVEATDWTTGTLASSSDALSSSMAQTTATSVLSSAEVHFSTSDLFPWAESSAGRSALFTVSGTGMVIFSVNYTLTVVAADSTGVGGEGYGHGSVYASLNLGDAFPVDPTGSGGAQTFLSLQNGDPGTTINGAFVRSGTLVVANFFSDGGTGALFADMEATAEASSILEPVFERAAVPIPGAFFLLAPAVGGLGFLRRCTS